MIPPTSIIFSYLISVLLWHVATLLSRFLVGSMLLIVLVFCVFCACTFWVPCCDVRYDFQINAMFGSSLPPVVCRRAVSYLRYLCLFAHNGVQHILCCVFVFFFLVLCIPCCQFLWIVHLWLPFRYSLTFISSLLKLRVVILVSSMIYCVYTVMTICPVTLKPYWGLS